MWTTPPVAMVVLHAGVEVEGAGSSAVAFTFPSTPGLGRGRTASEIKVRLWRQADLCFISQTSPLQVLASSSVTYRVVVKTKYKYPHMVFGTVSITW